MSRKLLTTFLLVIFLALAAFAPVYQPSLQGLQRFREILVTGPANFDGAVDFDNTVNFSGATVTGLAGDITGDTIISGTLTVTDSLQYGADDLYPLGYATDAQQMVCGTTAAFTATTVITPTGLSTVTYAIATQITTPAATGELLTISAPTTSTFVLSSWEADYTEGTTGVTAHWCAVGDQ